MATVNAYARKDNFRRIQETRKLLSAAQKGANSTQTMSGAVDNKHVKKRNEAQIKGSTSSTTVDNMTPADLSQHFDDSAE